jgi:hypothetical protein
MNMLELIIVESVIGIFLFLHIVRPYVRAFREADGFAFFPLAAVFCCAAMIPAYGIRPECFPLFLFALVYGACHLPSFLAVFSRFKQYPVRDNARILSFIAAAALAFSLGTAFRFVPYGDYRDYEETQTGNPQKTQLTVRDSARGIDLFVSYYRGSRGGDLVLLIPPQTIPLSLIKGMHTALAQAGYNVLAFSRPSFDITAVDQNGTAIELPFFEKIQRYIEAVSGIQNTKMAEAQLSVAAEREADIRFLLSALKTDESLRAAVLPDENAGYENVFLLGYGAGGAASVRLAGNKNFVRMNPAIKAASAIESIVLCSFSDPPGESSANTRQNIVAIFKGLFQNPLPRLDNIAHPEIPVLFVAGDSARQKNSYRRYMAVVQTMIESDAPFLFASIHGVHAIDFSSLSRQYPVLPFLLRANTQGAWPREDALSKTADYIAAFFSRVKENPSLAYLQRNLEMPEAVSLETSRQK